MRLTQSQAAGLADLCAQYRDQPVAWGTRDFLQFVRTAAQVLIGRDVPAGLRAAYASRNALDTLVSGAGGLVGVLNAYTGIDAQPMAPGLTRKGDLLLFRPFGRDTLGVAMSDVWAFTVSDAGLACVPVADAKLIWRLID